MAQLRYIRGVDLHMFPRLQETMFKDRAEQFVRRLGWQALSVDDRGWETDEYDCQRCLYVVWELCDGTHGASMRLLPMDGPNMIHDHFAHIVPKKDHNQSDIWECSRFVISPRSDRRATSALFVGAGELFRRQQVRAFLGLFDQRMLRVYKLMRNYPEIVGSAGSNDGWVAAGLWVMQQRVWERSLSKLSINREQSGLWYDESMSAGYTGSWNPEYKAA